MWESSVEHIMTSGDDIGQRMANLGIEEEENEVFVLEGDIDESENRYELCLVGRLLTEKNINTRAMKSKIADIWRPTMGLNIKELAQGLFLFQFYRREDMQWVEKGGHWSFDNAMLALEKVAVGENPAKIKPWFLNIWIQLYNLPMGTCWKQWESSLVISLENFWSMMLRITHQYGEIT